VNHLRWCCRTTCAPTPWPSHKCGPFYCYLANGLRLLLDEKRLKRDLDRNEAFCAVTHPCHWKTRITAPFNSPTARQNVGIKRWREAG